MAASPAQSSFTCAACGRKFRWTQSLAGRSVRCACGARFTAPAGAASSEFTAPPVVNEAATSDAAALSATAGTGVSEDRGLYELAAPPIVAPTAAAPPATVVPALAMSSSGVPLAQVPRTREKWRQPETDEDQQVPRRLWQIYAALGLIPAGVFVTLYAAMYSDAGGGTTFDRAFPAVAAKLLVTLPLTFGAVWGLSLTLEEGFEEPIWQIVVKLCGVAILPAPVGSIITSAMGYGDINASIAGVFSSVGLYALLFLLLFRISLLYSIAFIGVTFIIRALVEYTIFRMQGIQGDSAI